MSRSVLDPNMMQVGDHWVCINDYYSDAYHKSQGTLVKVDVTKAKAVKPCCGCCECDPAVKRKIIRLGARD